MANADLIDFNVIEDHKENIQALPSGRSAKALAALYSPPLTSTSQSRNNDDNIPDAHASARAEFDEELALIDEADDPLDVYDRYVKWTLDTYPSAQSTPQSKLLPLLERATKAFLSSTNYNNDPRYLKLWLHYIRFFSDTPRETFVFLCKHGIGESLALYYEEYAAWLEHSGRWTQAEEVYKMGIEKEAHPAARLLRKFGEFERRKEARPEGVSEPTSPALPAARPALAAKVDPFAAAADAAATQQRPTSAPGKKSKSGKMAIFSDDGPDAQSALGAPDSGKGWDSIGSLASRKKENTVEAKAWAGETLKGGKTNSGVQKMMIFRSSPSVRPAYESSKHTSQRVINPRTGRAECVFVNLEAVYPDPSNPSVEFCFEELMARHRGWLEYDWAAQKEDTAQEDDMMDFPQEQEATIEEEVPESPPKPAQRKGFAIFQDENAPAAPKPTIHRDAPAQPNQQPSQKRGFEIFHDGENAAGQENPQERPPVITIDSSFQVLSLKDENAENNPPAKRDLQTRDAQAQRDADLAIAKRLRKEERANRTRKIKVMDVETVQKETQTVKLNLSSPTGPKIRKRKVADPTMTINTKEAMDEIYGIFSQPVQTNEEPVEESESESDSDDDYTSGGESTTTGHISVNGSDYGDETRREILASQSTQDQQSEELDEEQREVDEDDADDVDDDTNASAWSDYEGSKHHPSRTDAQDDLPPAGNKKMEVFSDADLESQEEAEDDLPTPREDIVTPYADEDEPRTRYIPLPPEDYEPLMAQYRDPALVAQNRLPFMTPIVEHTESSIGAATGRTEKGYFAAKTPSRQQHNHVDQIPPIDEDGPWSSPFQDILNGASEDKRKILQPIRTKTTKGIVTLNGPKLSKTKSTSKGLTGDSQEPTTKGPIISDAQVNPVDPEVRQTILSQIRPPLTSYDGYHSHPTTISNRVPEIRKYSKAVANKKPSSSTSDKTASTLSLPPLLAFDGTSGVYTLKRELGAGAFAPVYLVENSAPTTISSSYPSETNDENENDAPPARMGHGAFTSTPRHALEAIKMEDPPSVWEFYMIRQTHRRLNVSRAAESIVHAYEMHVFADEGFLVEEFRSQGTLLDLVNVARAAEGGSMDELLAMFFAVELLRTVEALHKAGIVHGDIKGDNVLVRFDESDSEWSTAYSRDGRNGWNKKGVTLIDFGRGIDMKVFAPGVQFVADWPTSSADCAEMREMRPWTYQVDYHGLAGLLHSLLFGKYMTVVAEKGVGLGSAKTYRIKEGLKRYWQMEIWSEVFALLLNPLQRVREEEGEKLPVLKGLKGCRERMEGWLEANCERGVGLKGAIRKMEEAVRARKR